MRKESKKAKKERAEQILYTLDLIYGTSLRCALNYHDAWELLVATMLSAQCTDKRVNTVTPALFKRYPSVFDFSEADTSELMEYIRPTGFYRMKAKHIKACAGEIIERHSGKVPSGIEDLTALSGVGRKTANVIRGNIYKIPSIVVDTHVLRISRLLELTDTPDPVKAEFELMEILPEDHWILWNIDIITLGRTICIAGRPKCAECFLAAFCPAGQEKLRLT